MPKAYLTGLGLLVLSVAAGTTTAIAFLYAFKINISAEIVAVIIESNIVSCAVTMHIVTKMIRQMASNSKETKHGK